MGSYSFYKYVDDPQDGEFNILLEIEDTFGANDSKARGLYMDNQGEAKDCSAKNFFDPWWPRTREDSTTQQDKLEEEEDGTKTLRSLSKPLSKYDRPISLLKMASFRSLGTAWHTSSFSTSTR